MQQQPVSVFGTAWSVVATAVLVLGNLPCAAPITVDAIPPPAGRFTVEDAGFRDHPPDGDYNPETRIRLAVSVEVLIAFLWILMVASTPLVVLKLEGRNITKTQLYVFVVMWIVFLGGIFLFTNILLFQSVHWEGVRSLTIVECVYFMSQILTTVGYGDIVPARPRAQVFVGLYVLLSLLVIANVVSEVANMVAEQTQSYVRRFEETVIENLMDKVLSKDMASKLSFITEEDLDATTHTPRTAWVRNCAPPLPWKRFAQCLLGYISWCVLGVLFFTSYPGEEKNCFQAIYMSVITLSTVGFGAFTPLTEAGKVFGAFWMFFGSTTLVALVSCFTELMAAVKVREKFIRELHEVHHLELFHNLPDRIDCYTFTRFALLHANLVEENQIDMIDRTFVELGPVNGTLDKKVAERLLEPEEPAAPQAQEDPAP